MTIKGIFFDAAGVLYTRSGPTEGYALDLARAAGASGELSRGQSAQKRAWRLRANIGEMSADEYWDNVLRLYGVESTQVRQTLVPQINEFSNRVTPLPGAVEALAELKQRGFYLGIITDTMYPVEVKKQWLASVGVAPYVDALTCSTVLHARKPEPAMYLQALQQAGLKPEEAAFVGHAADELEGAGKVGLVTVAVNYETGTTADYYAPSALGLLDLPIFQIPQAGRAATAPVDIEIIFMDVGNTLRIVIKDEAYQAGARQELAKLVGTTEPPDQFCARLDERYKVYRKWAFDTLREARESELWTRWMLPDWPADHIAPLAGKLTYVYRQTMGFRQARHDAEQAVIELHRRGYRLGILSNTITEAEIPRWLEEDGLRGYFDTIVLSAVLGHRKPGTEIFVQAASQAGVSPDRAAYVGDNPSRDVPGSRRSGFGLTIIMLEPGEEDGEDLTGENQPDYLIRNLTELLEIFPPRPQKGGRC